MSENIANRNDNVLYAFTGKSLKKCIKYNLDTALLVPYSNEDAKIKAINTRKSKRELAIRFKKTVQSLERKIKQA